MKVILSLNGTITLKTEKNHPRNAWALYNIVGYKEVISSLNKTVTRNTGAKHAYTRNHVTADWSY